jgi:antitoxin CcdA
MSKASAPVVRKAASVSLDSALLDEARALDVDASSACERGLAEQVAETRAERWRRENAEAIASFNDYVERNGLPLARYRPF